MLWLTFLLVPLHLHVSAVGVELDSECLTPAQIWSPVLLLLFPFPVFHSQSLILTWSNSLSLLKEETRELTPFLAGKRKERKEKKRKGKKIYL